MIDGVLVIDKPAGTSSARAVDLVKRRLGATRAGHTGTLDPLATGVLPICLGVATKLAAYMLADDKAYEAEGVLGAETDTLDRTGTVVATRGFAHVSRAMLEAAIAKRTGAQQQVPPMYSAIKQGGKRLYRLARAGEDVARPPRDIRIDRLELVAFEPPRFRLAIACSKGTYVRSLIADLGDDVGAGAHLAELRRTRSGRFMIEQALALDDVSPEAAAVRMVSASAAVELPIVHVPPALVALVFGGVQLSPGALGVTDCGPTFQLVADDGRLLALARAEPDRIIYQRVFGVPDRA